MKIASWNVNSVKARLPHLLAFLRATQVDVLCLQETKCLAAEFPRAEVDFVEDLMGASFQIRNPNAASSCGCGNSFAIA